jgi:hypothetical protein
LKPLILIKSGILSLVPLPPFTNSYIATFSDLFAAYPASSVVYLDVTLTLHDVRSITLNFKLVVSNKLSVILVAYN